MATNHDDDAPSIEPEDKASPEAPAEKVEKPAKPAAPRPIRPTAKPGDKAAASPEKRAKPPAPPARPAGQKPVRPAAPGEKAAAKASPEKRPKPPVEQETAEYPADAPDGDAEGEEKPDAETAVQAAPPVKGKKKAKTETGIAAKPSRSFFNFGPAAPAGVWGVDLGQCALKAIRLEVIDGEVTATAFDYVEHPKILSQPDADPDELTREALQKFLSRNTLRGDTVAISVPGQSGLARFVKLPPVEEKKIPDIVKFEAKQQIPFNLDEVVWDYQKLGLNELAAGFVETEIGLFAMKRDMVSRYLQHFKDVGVEVHLVQMAPLALCNYVAYDLLGRESSAPAAGEEAKGKRHCITALDIGADSSNLVITDGARIIWQRPIPLGGNHFTRALTKDLKLTFAKAEHLKRNAVKSPDLKKILASLKPVLADFVGEVQRSLGYFTNTHRDAQIDYMIGLGNAFRLPGLQRYLAEKLQMEVKKLGKMERLTGDGVVASATYTENILSFGVAYGLALQGLKRTKLQTNLLPSEIRAERAVRGKKPWAVAAAALLMVGIGGFGLASWLNCLPFTAEPVLKAEERSKSAYDKAVANKATFDKTKSDALDEEKAVRGIIAGQTERKDWLELTRFLFTQALPSPDGKNLSDAARQQYWDKGGNVALDEMRNRQKGKGSDAPKDAPPPPPKDVGPGVKPPEAAPSEDLGAHIDDLIQVNVEYFDQRYTDNLGVAWKQLLDSQKAFTATDPTELKNYVRSTDATKPPDGKGWLVEIHGTTYHKEPKQFLANTLVDNIYRLSFKPGGPDQPAAPAVGTPIPATPPVPPVSPPGMPTGDANKAPVDPDPVKGKISYVVLFDAHDVRDATRPSIVGQSVLDLLVKPPSGNGLDSTNPGMPAPSASAGAPTMSPSMPGPGGPTAPVAGTPTRDTWIPLSPSMKSSSGVQNNGLSTPFNDPSKPKTAPPASGHTRTEFVVVFVWKEPTPSDTLRGEDDKPPVVAPPVVAPPPAMSASTPAPAATPGDN